MPFTGANIRESYLVLRVHLRWNLDILLTLLKYDLIIDGQERGSWQQRKLQIARGNLNFVCNLFNKIPRVHMPHRRRRHMSTVKQQQQQQQQQE